jgi:hypothetical protein
MIHEIKPAVNNNQGFNSNFVEGGIAETNQNYNNDSPYPINEESPNNRRNDNQGFESNVINPPNRNYEPIQENNIIVNIEVPIPRVVHTEEPLFQMDVDNFKMNPKKEEKKKHRRENAKIRIIVCKFLKKFLMVSLLFAILSSCALIVLGVLLKSNASKTVGDLVISFAVVCILFLIYGWNSFSKY